MCCQRWLPLAPSPPGQPPFRQQPHAQHRVCTGTRLSAVLILEEDVDGGGWTAVDVGGPARGEWRRGATPAWSHHWCQSRLRRTDAGSAGVREAVGSLAFWSRQTVAPGPRGY